jgi:putative copper export protein
MIKGLLFIGIALVFGLWWWRENYQPSPLEKHFADLEAKAQIGNLAQLAAYATQPVSAMLGTGWGTTFILNPYNDMYNRPGKVRLNMRFAQPTGNN